MTRTLRTVAIATLITLAATACSRHNDADTAVPGGGNPATASTAPAPGNASTAAQAR